MYATEKASNFVQDIILSNTPVFDVDIIFAYGPIFLWAIITALGLYEPKRIPFILKSIALFLVIRSIFITLTHIGPFPDHILLDRGTDWISKFTSGADLFFSAHTGEPYLMALIFWDQKYLRLILIGISILFGIVVLLGHLHYSIDVASAYFITFSIYRLAEIFFAKDKEYFHEKMVS